MTRRLLLAALGLAPAAALAQLDFGIGRPALTPGRGDGVDEALRRTVTLVLRAEARAGTLPDFMTDPAPLPEADLDRLTVGARLPDDVPMALAPERVDRRLPHARGGSVWVVAGTWMLEVDPSRRRILAIAHDVLPPDLTVGP